MTNAALSGKGHRAFRSKSSLVPRWGLSTAIPYPNCGCTSTTRSSLRLRSKHRILSSHMQKNKSILIVEDEPIIAADIASILLNNGYTIAGKANSAERALQSIKATTPDLMLLDIKIEGATDGIMLAREIKAKYTLPHIFLTSYYDQQTLAHASETLPAGYIVKPFDERDLLINVGLALHKNQMSVPKTVPSDKFFVRNQQDMVAVEVKDIYYVQADDNYATLFTAKGKHIVSHTLKSVEEKLVPFGFVRVHRSYLVSFQKITSICEGHVFLELHKVPLGQSYREELIKQLSFL
jgi:DNA-binding LytR/AlgR family response regulator